ncbi:MAG: hypothetical protein AAGE61_00500 [Pseudomonadota bacterium]
MTRAFSDADLTAYLDGELEDASERELEMALARDPDLVARLEALDFPRDEVKTAFDTLLDKAPPPPSMPRPLRNTGQMRPLLIAASLIVGISIGVLMSSPVTYELTDDWKLAVANYQALYVAETLTPDDPDPEGTGARIAAFSETLGRDLRPALNSVGLTFRRAQILGLNGAPLVQMAYLSEGGVPFAICMTRVDEADYAPMAETLVGLAAAHWVDDGIGFLVIGGGDEAFVENIARDLSARL